MSLEERVTERLRSLDDTSLDRIARAYARFRFPQRFSWIDGLGVNDESQPIGGRPDAFVRSTDGSLDRIEVTRHASKSQIRDKSFSKGHFSQVLKGITSSGIGGGLVYVAGHPKIQFTPDELAEMTDAAVRAGLTRERVHIIGGDALADALCRPDLAGIRIRILGIDNPKRFELLLPEHSPDQRRLSHSGVANPFIPTADDLARGAVYFPQLGHDVLRILHNDRVSLIRGLGASGKSVLAWLLGLKWGESGDPAYMLNLQSFTGDIQALIGEALQDLQLYWTANALFIIDNCHLEEEAVRKIYQGWKSVEGRRPALLLLGRETRARTGTRIDGLDVDPVLLRAQQAEVLGVYNRLVSRAVDFATVPAPIPPSTVLDRWVETFGGTVGVNTTTVDLIAFSAALQRRMNDILQGDWRLSEEDAAEEIRSHYIRPLSDGERQNLYFLASLQKLELPMPDDLMPAPIAGFAQSSNELGIVFSRTGSLSDPGVLYQLAHPALSNLILKSSGHIADELDLYKRVAATRGPRAAGILNRLRGAGRSLEARAICETIAHNPKLLAEMAVSEWKPVLRSLQDFQSRSDLDLYIRQLLNGEHLTGVLAKLTDCPGDAAADFLEYLEKSKVQPFSFMHAIIAKSLVKQEWTCRIIATATAGALSTVYPYLRYLEWSRSRHLAQLFSRLVTTLSNPDHQESLLRQVMTTPPDDLTSFLRYLAGSRDNRLQALHSALVKTLLVETYFGDFVDNLLKFPLDKIACFLRYLQQSGQPSLGDLCSSIFQRIIETSGTETVSKQALNGSAESLEAFITTLPEGELLDRVLKAISDKCSEPAEHVWILEKIVSGMIMRADIEFLINQQGSGVEELKKVESIFGVSPSRSINELVRQAITLRANIHISKGELQLAADAMRTAECRS